MVALLIIEGMTRQIVLLRLLNLLLLKCVISYCYHPQSVARQASSGSKFTDEINLSKYGRNKSYYQTSSKDYMSEAQG